MALLECGLVCLSSFVLLECGLAGGDKYPTTHVPGFGYNLFIVYNFLCLVHYHANPSSASYLTSDIALALSNLPCLLYLLKGLPLNR